MPIDLALLDVAPTSLRPGDTVRFKVAWSAAAAPERVEVRLVYRTAGKGTTDVVRVAGDSRPSPGSNGAWDVSLTLPPDSPPSYDGRLLSVSWFAQAEVIGPKRGDRETGELPLVLSPTSRPLVPQRLTK